MKRFESEFDRSFRRQKTFVSIFIGAVFVIILCVWGFMAFIAVNASGKISEDGVRGALTEVWCGKKNPDCFQKDLDSLGGNR